MMEARTAGKLPIAVIGAGTMGAGIAQIFAQAGYPVRLQARKRETLEAALRRVRVNQDELIRHELLAAADAEAARGRIAVTQDLQEALAGAAFVSENIPERLDLKQPLFAELDRLTPTETILSTNTSSLPITQVVRDTKHPERVVGFHWSVVGPLEHADLAGVDTHSATVSLLFPLLSTDTQPPPLFADLVAKGRLGAKTGAGVYEYGPGEVERILARRNTMLIDFIKVLKKHPPLRAPSPHAE
jgi:3-hydroxybutyryl-CoA dehydrogenase